MKKVFIGLLMVNYIHCDAMLHLPSIAQNDACQQTTNLSTTNRKESPKVTRKIRLSKPMKSCHFLLSYTHNDTLPSDSILIPKSASTDFRMQHEQLMPQSRSEEHMSTNNDVISSITQLFDNDQSAIKDSDLEILHDGTNGKHQNSTHLSESLHNKPSIVKPRTFTVNPREIIGYAKRNSGNAIMKTSTDSNSSKIEPAINLENHNLSQIQHSDYSSSDDPDVF